MAQPPLPMGRVHEGKLALITGSARSIGAHIARNLAAKGANILINYATTSSDEPAAALAQELASAHGVRAVPVRADISTPEGCAALLAAARTHFADPTTSRLQIDILIHNAAIAIVGPLESVTPADFTRIYATNVLGPTLLTAACAPHLPTDRSGRIVLMSSVNAKVGTPHTTLYAGTKAAVEALARVWCRELAERATVNAVNPGPVMTDMYFAAPEGVKRALALWNPLTPLVRVRPEVDTDPAVRELGEKFGGRAAYAEEVAGVVVGLCSPEMGWCTGNLVGCNGGMSFSY